MENKKKTPVPPLTSEVLQDAAILRTQSRRDDSDILGSYTGTAADGEEPEQDVDDL